MRRTYLISCLILFIALIFMGFSCNKKTLPKSGDNTNQIKEYEMLVAEADSLYEIGFSDAAYKRYKRANELMPNETYAREQIKKIDNKVEKGDISLIHKGAGYCLPDLKILIAGKEFDIKGSTTPISDLPLGEVEYEISGTLDCADLGFREATRIIPIKNTIDIKPGAVFYLNVDGHSQELSEGTIYLSEEFEKDHPDLLLGSSMWGEVAIIYRGDNFGCGLDLNIQIGGRSIPFNKDYVLVEEVPLGYQPYQISGTINCTELGSCTMQLARNDIEIRDGDEIFLYWENHAHGACRAILRTENQLATASPGSREEEENEGLSTAGPTKEEENSNGGIDSSKKNVNIGSPPRPAPITTAPRETGGNVTGISTSTASTNTGGRTAIDPTPSTDDIVIDFEETDPNSTDFAITEPQPDPSIELEIPEDALPETLSFDELSAAEEACVFNRTEQGVVAYNNLEETQHEGTPFYFKLALDNIQNRDSVVKIINPELTDQQIEGLDFSGDTVDNVVVTTLALKTYMRVDLTQEDDAFQIEFTQDESTREQKVDCELPATWEWKITPLEPGSHTLKLKIYLGETKEDMKLLPEKPHHQRTFIIKAKPMPWYVKAGIPAGLVGLCLIGYMVYLKSKPKQFGTSLGAFGAAAAAGTKPKSVFIAYAKKDEEWTTRIYNHLKSLDKAGFVNIWYDQMANIGEDYKQQVMDHLNKADVIILNVSADFLACDLCDEILEQVKLRNENDKNTTIVPILLRQCLWGTSPIGQLQIYPKNQKPLSDRDWDNPDEAIFEVMTEIESLLLK